MKYIISEFELNEKLEEARKRGHSEGFLKGRESAAGQYNVGYLEGLTHAYGLVKDPIDIAVLRQCIDTLTDELSGKWVFNVKKGENNETGTD